MELKDLRYFIAVTQEGTITRAAEKLCIAQPHLSRQMQKLEEELGVSLFLRGKRHIRLTEEGMYLKQQAKDILFMLEQTEMQLLQLKNDTIGTVTVGVTESSGMSVLSEVITPFQEQYPNMKFNIWCGNGDEIRDKLDKGLVDLGIVREPLNVEKYECEIYKAEAWGTLLSVKNPLASKRKDSIELEDLSGQPLIVPSRASLQDEIVSWFHEHALGFRITCMYNILSSVIPLVANNAGIAICPESAVFFSKNQDLIYRRITNPEHLSNILFIRNRDYRMSAAAGCFWDYVRLKCRKKD